MTAYTGRRTGISSTPFPPAHWCREHMVRVLVTGGTGFLGSSLAQHLLLAGHSVRVLTRSYARSTHLVRRGADRIMGDLTDRDVVRTAVQDVDIVFHLAGQLFTPDLPVIDYERTHVEGTEILLSCCRE